MWLVPVGASGVGPEATEDCRQVVGSSTNLVGPDEVGMAKYAPIKFQKNYSPLKRGLMATYSGCRRLTVANLANS